MATGNTAAIRKAAMDKQKATCAARLIPRLARFFGDDSSGGKQRIRSLLVSGGYPGPGWDDEARAIAILQQAGKDMTKFERAGTVLEASMEGFFKEPGNERKGPVSIVTPRDNAAEKLKNVTIILMQAEREIVSQFKAGKLKSLGGLAVTVGAALDEIRR